MIAHEIISDKLNKQLTQYKNYLRKCKDALEFINQINIIDINEIHCDSKHFKKLKSKSDFNNVLNQSVKKSVSIIPKTMMEQWKMMKEEFTIRVALINHVVISLRELIKNNNYNELKLWALKGVAWSDKLPNSVLINGSGRNIVNIKIAVENFMMLDNANFCNCYVVAKSRNPRNPNVWNLYGAYNKDMYCFSPNSMQNKFAEYIPKESEPSKKNILNEIITNINNPSICVGHLKILNT
jgi:hypothetical protein